MSTAGTPANTSPISLVAPSGGVVRGLTYVVGDNFAVAMETKDEGLPFEALVAGPVWAAKDQTVSIEACAKVYLDESTGLITSDSAETEIGGFALALAGTPDATVAIMLGQPGAASLSGVTGASNTALGDGSLTSLTSGAENTAVGVDALGAVSSADGNVALGFQANLNGTGASNTAIGWRSMVGGGAHNGYQNTAVGVDTLTSLSTGAENVAAGGHSLSLMTTGIKNSAIGNYAGDEIVAGAGNALIGYQAGKSQGDVSNKFMVGLGNGQGIIFTVNEAGSLDISVRYAAGTMKTATIALA